MSAAFGAYGKMPSLGDFFRINLPRSFVEPWDAWLQKSLAASQSALGAAWEEAYMSAPIWRFSLPRNVAGAAPMLGVLMVSVDKVGRKFPLTLASPQAADHDEAAQTFEALEDAALMALEDSTTRDSLASALGTIPQPHTALGPSRCLWSSSWQDRACRFESQYLPSAQQALSLFQPQNHFQAS